MLNPFIAALDRWIGRTVDKEFTDRPFAPATAHMPPLKGIDPASILNTLDASLNRAQERRQDIEAEIARLEGALHDTNIAIGALKLAVGDLESNMGKLDLTGADLDLDFDDLGRHPLNRMADLSGHTSSERRLEEYGKTVMTRPYPPTLGDDAAEFDRNLAAMRPLGNRPPESNDDGA